MLRSMRMKNFKSWADTGDIRLAPITGFYGANSSGKTSLLQMLLLMKQTVMSSDPRQVLFLGDENSLVNLGTFHDVVHFHDVSRKLQIRLAFQIPVPEAALGGIEVFMDELGVIPEDIEDTSLEFSVTIREKNQRLLVDKFSYLDAEEKPLGMVLSDPESEEYTIETKGFGMSKYSEATTKLKPIQFYEFPREVIQPFGVSGFAFASMLSGDFEKLISNFEYLGPLRDYPQRTYVWSGDNPSNVGRRGERTVAALLSNRAETGEKRIEAKVAEWLQKMGLIHSFALQPIAKGRRDYEIVVKKTPHSPEALITDVGFGVSQLLPVLVLCYYVPEGSTLILEQPEIHLHPSVQADLADVFIDVIKTRKLQIIFESHSEYLLHRLQRRMAEEGLTPEGIAKDQVALYFCEVEGEESKLKELQLDEYGNISNWPKDFFGDVTGDLVAMTEAEMQRKMAGG